MGFIYLMTNKINGLQYVGQTSSTIELRMRGHKHEAKVLKPNVYFVRAMHKYGFENFEVKVLEECPDEMLDEKEIYWIAEYDTFLGPGYNSTCGGRGNKKFSKVDVLELWNAGYTRSEIADKLNCSAATVSNNFRALNISEEEVRKRGQSQICKKKEVLQYDLSGQLIAKYSCVDEAACAINHSAGCIRAVCNHHTSTAYGYIWCHIDEPKPIEQLIKEIPIPKRNHPVNRYNLEGKLIKEYNSCIEASKELNVDSCCIADAAKGAALTCYKSLWKYADDDSDIQIKVTAYNQRKDYLKKKVDQYDLSGKYLMTHNSAADAAKFIDKKNGSSSITKACRGKLKTAYKYIWKYHEESSFDIY